MFGEIAVGWRGNPHNMQKPSRLTVAMMSCSRRTSEHETGYDELLRSLGAD